MFTVTILSSPAHPALSPDLPEFFAKRWSGSPVRWLAEGEAAEFDVFERPTDFWKVWAELQTCDVDLVIQASAGRMKRVLLADMDSTMIDQECIDELGDVAGFGEQISAITARAMNGELDFEAALDARVALLKGLPVSVIDDVLRERITLASGARVLIATLRALGVHCVLVSGGFTRFTALIAEKLRFHENHANTLLADGAVLTGTVARPVLGRQAKVDRLNLVVTERGLLAADVLAVGDGANDLGMLHLAGTGVALHAKPSVAAQSEIRVNHGDLTALLYLMGIPKAEFRAG